MISAHVPVQISDDEIIKVARQLYGIDGSLQRLPGEYDTNVKIWGDKQADVVLKIMHPSRIPSFIEMQIAALQHISTAAPAVPVQRVVAQRDGLLWSTVTIGTHSHVVWMLTYLEGTLFAEANPVDDALVAHLGETIARIDHGLQHLAFDAPERMLEWDVLNAGWIRGYTDALADEGERSLITRLVDRFESHYAVHRESVRIGLIHGDANDYNVIVGKPGYRTRRVTGVLDFGDMMRTAIVSELAISAAYMMMRHPDPIDALMVMTAAYHRVFPLTEGEVAVLFDMICMRLAISVTVSAIRKRERPDDPYMVVSEAPAWRVLHVLAKQHHRMMHYRLRDACGFVPVPQHNAVVEWISRQQSAPLIGRLLDRHETVALDLSVGSTVLGADPRNATMPRFAQVIESFMDGRIGIGGYLEPRMIYTTDRYTIDGRINEERRTLHLAIDFWGPAGTPVHATLPGTVYMLEYLPADLDYGYLTVLKHETDDGTPFFTVYGHLSDESMRTLVVGQHVAVGQRIGSFGIPDVNGKWPTHVHFQIVLDFIDMGRDFPGVGYASQQSVWASLSPSPNLLLRMDADRFPAPQKPLESTLAERRERMGGNLSISYKRPLKIVRGWQQYLYDSEGRAYIDAYNNVAHVGHCHPRVVQAATAQYGLLSTNTRYLNDQMQEYARRLCATLPDALSVCYFVNSASEANELALRMMKAYTKSTDIIVLDAAYHGHTNTLIDISPYKHDGPGGTGAPDWVHTAFIPDDYRGPFKRHDPLAGRKYADQVQSVIARIQSEGRTLGGYIAETLPSVGGQIVLPAGYLAGVYDYVRAAGGVCIADEVQVGFGRIGTHFWAFQAHDVIPDIVVMGKPIGNGQPMGAVVTTRAIADAFNNGMEYFATFGGNNVSVAAGLAVLDVLRDQPLQQNALDVGQVLLAGLRRIAPQHAIIGDVRGAGLFLGVELVRSQDTLEPADDEASYVSNRLRDYGILAGTDGPYHNVVKIRPPMPFNHENAAYVLACFAQIMTEDFLHV
jgi:4-aminobutyrate aminotransferase-like enzyme/Ser/Thr protein kinase RdoA (MazF antagonist)